MMVVEPKLVQLVEPNEELVNLLSSTGWMVQKPYLFSGMLVQPVKVQPQPVDPHLNRLRSGQGVVEAHQSLVKY